MTASDITILLREQPDHATQTPRDGTQRWVAWPVVSVEHPEASTAASAAPPAESAEDAALQRQREHLRDHLLHEHRSHRVGWLRAAVLGANDGIVSVSGLVIGVAAATTVRNDVLTAGIAGLVAGALSMAIGEYVSVSSQRDTEEADLRIEAEALAEHPHTELRELARIYETRGVEPGLARLVAEQLMAHDELGAHARDELGITEVSTARPFQAAYTSAAAFTIGALLPVLASVVAPTGARIALIAVVALIALGALGALGAWAGGAPWQRATVRVLLLSSSAMLVTWAIGRLVGATI
jgi:VIT1/CCC1 family predicted Fe2+/Mn2+ transporter